MVAVTEEPMEADSIGAGFYLWDAPFPNFWPPIFPPILPPLESEVTVTVSPASVNIPPNARKTFTAEVTGATDETVTWSCTGGTITSGGIFTAGATEGAATVTATSNEDPTASDTAEVDVSIAPPEGYVRFYFMREGKAAA